MKYTHQDLPPGKLYADGDYVPFAEWFDTTTGVYQHFVPDDQGRIQLDYATMHAR